MLRIAMLQLGYETNTFMGTGALLAELGSGGWMLGGKIIETFSGTRTAFGGALAAIDDLNAIAVPMDSITRGGAFNAGRKMAKTCVQEAMDHICAQLLKRQEEYDGVYYAMHGAGCAEGFEDADAYFLQRIRQVIGEKPLVASLDLHGNITKEMAELADGLFGIKENPHTDFYEAGYLAASTLIQTLRGEKNPKVALQRLPLLLEGNVGCTLDGVFGEIRDYLKEYVKSHDLLDATFFHGFSATDSITTSASVVVVGDGFVPKQEAQELAQYIWSRRAEFRAQVYSAKEAVEIALSKVKNRYVVINEGSDNPGGGCPGDGTHLLQEFLRRDLPGTIMGPLFDPEAAAICHQHQVGDKFSLTLGGKTMAVFGNPLVLPDVELLALCDGTFQCATPMYCGATMCYGPTARIRSGNVEMIVVSVRFQTYDDRPFLMTGVKMENYRIVGLKSMNHFRAYFRNTADALVGAETPSAHPSDVRKLPYLHIRRPIYPLDEDVKFTCQWLEEYT